jgi:chitinase
MVLFEASCQSSVDSQQMKNISHVRFGISVLSLLMIVACASQPGATVVPTPEPGFTSTFAPSRTTIPSATITTMPSATPSPIPSSTPSVTPPSSAFKIVGYLAGWNVYGSRNYHIADIPADKLTHLNYAFGTVSAGGLCMEDNPSGDHANFAELQKLKQRYPQLRTLISLGGADGSKYFSVAVKTAESRKKFVESCVRFMRDNGFDGIDIDWEFPSNAEDKQNYAAMLAEFRAQLSARNLLTIAAPAGPEDYAGVSWTSIARDLDWINLMTYDFAGSWSSMTGFNAPLYASSSDPAKGKNAKMYNGQATAQAYISAGVPANKIYLGVPFYGRGWKGVADMNHGLYQKFDGVPKGTEGDGAFDYRDLKQNYLATYTRYWSDEAKVPWLYNPATQIMISYDDPESIGIKADYARAQKLGGVMIWELLTDDDQHSLLNAIYMRLK